MEEKPPVPVPKPKANPKKKPKKKGDPDSKRSKLVSDLEDAIGDRDKARLEKAVTAAKRELESNPAEEGDELASFLQQAQSELRSINRETERQVLIQKLKAAGKSGTEEHYQSLEEKLRELLKKDADDEDVVAAVEAEIAAARELLDAQLEKQRERSAAMNELAAAMEAEDIDRLTEAIETAGRLSVPFTTGILVGIGETREDRVGFLHALATLPTVDYHRQARRRAWVLRRGDTTVEVALEPRLETNEPEVALAAALAGLGIANLPGLLVRGPLEQGRLQHVLPGWRAQVGPVLLLYPPHVHPPARLEALLAAVDALALDLPGPIAPR